MNGGITGSKVSPEAAHQEMLKISRQKIIALQNKSGHYFQDG